MAASPNPVGSEASTALQVESPRVPFASSTPRMESITQLHAAAVNGEKQVLSRLIAGSGPGELDIGDQFGRNPLMYCVLADRLECAELLLKTGSQVNFRDKGGRTALHWAAHKGNYRLMKALLSRGADCREKDNEGQTPLHLCTRHKLPKCMAILLRQLVPGEIDNQDNNKRTALHWAASYGNLEHVKMLIKQDSNIGIPDIEGKTPLHWAASSRDPEAVQCVRLILETTPSVINWQDYEGRTALHLAVADGNQSIVDLLTSVEKCNVSALDNVFRTPLHWAAVLGHSAIVGQLLRSNADPTSSDSNGATPLHYAAQNNFDQTVNVFLLWKNTDEPDLEGRTAFMWAAGKGADNVLRVFFHHGVDVMQDDKTGGTALHAAAFSGHAATVQLLLQHGARINATDQAKHTPLFRACEMGHTDVAQALIDSGARVDVLDEDGRSPLHWAALGGHAYICQMLIKYGVDPNIRDHSGRTPLHCAAFGGYVNCMSALMEHQADPNTQDKEGMACLHWACSKGHLDAVKLLVENDAFPNHMQFREERYTPLDYTLMGEHHDVAQYMIEQGALSITGIQDIAATKIQSAFRGYRVRKTFIERKKLLMKHEMLKKEVARKRAEEDKKKSEEQLKKETGEETVQETPPASTELPMSLQHESPHQEGEEQQQECHSQEQEQSIDYEQGGEMKEEDMEKDKSIEKEENAEEEACSEKEKDSDVWKGAQKENGAGKKEQDMEKAHRSLKVEGVEETEQEIEKEKSGVKNKKGLEKESGVGKEKHVKKEKGGRKKEQTVKKKEGVEKKEQGEASPALPGNGQYRQCLHLLDPHTHGPQHDQYPDMLMQEADEEEEDLSKDSAQPDEQPLSKPENENHSAASCKDKHSYSQKHTHTQDQYSQQDLPTHQHTDPPHSEKEQQQKQADRHQHHHPHQQNEQRLRHLEPCSSHRQETHSQHSEKESTTQEKDECKAWKETSKQKQRTSQHKQESQKSEEKQSLQQQQDTPAHSAQSTLTVNHEHREERRFWQESENSGTLAESAHRQNGQQVSDSTSPKVEPALGHSLKGRKSLKDHSATETAPYTGKRTAGCRKKELQPSSTTKVLQTKAERQIVKKTEKQRREDFQRKQLAACIIQRAWRKHKRTKGQLRRQQRSAKEDPAQNDAKLLRLQNSQAEWERQIAALTIQLAWRKFFRRKLLKSLNPNRRQLKMWDPEIVALKQQALIAEIYTEQLVAPFWHPILRAPVRPFWFQYLPSPAAVSFNFAVDQYHPLNSWVGMRPHSWTGPVNLSSQFDYTPSASIRPERSENAQFSYNLRKA